MRNTKVTSIYKIIIKVSLINIICTNSSNMIKIMQKAQQ